MLLLPFPFTFILAFQTIECFIFYCSVDVTIGNKIILRVFVSLELPSCFTEDQTRCFILKDHVLVSIGHQCINYAISKECMKCETLPVPKLS